MLVLMFDAIRLFWRLLCKCLFQDFVSCNFPKDEDLIPDGVGFLSILLLEWYRIQIAKNNKWTCFFLSIWLVIYRLHEWQQKEELNIFFGTMKIFE